MSSLKKFDYRIKDNRKRNIFLCGIILVVITIVGVKLYQSKAEFTGTSSELNLANGSVVIPGTYYLKELAKTSNELVYDETVDNNLRYIGKDPNNYVEFNEELWRIIGVMNNIEDGTGKKESRIKLIRNESLGQFNWDNKQPGIGSSINNYGSNDWLDSQLMMMLNPVDVVKENWQNTAKSNYEINSEGYVLDSNNHKIYKGVGSYYNHEKGYIPNIVTITEEFTEEEVDFREIGLKDESKILIDRAIFNLGVITNAKLTNEYYIDERGVGLPNGTQNRKTLWTGYIGLMYPSDFGFATSGGTNKTRLECLAISTSIWSNSENSVCYVNNWLYKQEQYQWTISPYIVDSYDAISVYPTGRTWGHVANSKDYVYPVVYLKPSVKITGEGTKENPFKLSI